MQILLPTDVFPPRCGGAGWSSHALARALIARGHHVTAIVPVNSSGGPTSEDVLGVPTVRLPYRAPGIPFVKNYARHERLWPKLAATIAELATGEPLVIHAQHVQTAPAAVLAGQRLGAPVVVTVRDHWPWDYFATGLHGNRVPYERQTWASLATDLVAREGSVRGSVGSIAIPYMLAHTRRRQEFLRRADAVIAVSEYIAQRLCAVVPAERIHVVPNMVDTAEIARTSAAPPESVAGPYLLYVGKLDRNKGADLLVPVFRALASRSDVKLPTLVLAGNGALRGELEHELGTLGVATQFLDWAEHDEVLRLMAHCELLLFPSRWGEPLSRVWLEAAAGGAPMLAMPTGGIHDIIRDGENGALAATPERFAARMAELLQNPAERERMRNATRETAQARFDTAQVVAQVEALYTSLR